MVTVQWYEGLFEYDYAVKHDTSIDFYNAELELVNQIINITPIEWKHISIQNGEWSPENLIPTDIDQIHADIDFLQMENDALTMENEQLRADVDYCLMLLDGGDNGSE